jgi:hypothetical protein
MVTVGLSGRAAAQEPAPMGAEARGHFDQGMALYAARDFRAAARELEAAYALEPRREILFAQAQATRLAEDCPAALPLYQRFLDTQPPAQQIEATRIAVTRCQAAEAAPRSPALPAAPVAIARATAPPVAGPPRPPFYRDARGNLLVGAGLVAAGVGAALMASAAALDRSARGETVLGDYGDVRQSAERRWRIGLGAVVVGAALAVAGAGRYLWVSRDGAGLGSRF